MKVLIVDNSKTMRMIVKRGIRQAGFEAHEVLEAEGGAEAIALIERDKPALVLCDWNMPGMNGIDVLKALRAKNCDVPFGFITSEGTAEMQALAAEAGAQFYIAKPFTNEQLRGHLEKFLT
jgi:two-component system, chemotaxis family, chemotaxis protein CheY